MTRFGDLGYLLACGVVFVGAVLFRVVERLPDWWRNRHHHVAHFKLRAVEQATARTGGAAVRRSGEQPHPAPGGPETIPGAGTQTSTLRAASLTTLGDASLAARTASVAHARDVEAKPAPRPPTPSGAGPNSGPLTVDLARDSFPVADGSHPECWTEVTLPGLSSVSGPAAQTVATAAATGLGPKQPVTVVGSPVPMAVAGPHLPALAQIDWETAGVPGPRPGTPVGSTT